MLGVVFVYGVRSSARAWDAFAGLMAGDEELLRVAAEPVPRFGYATGVWRSSFKPLTVIPSVSTAADSLKEYLLTEAAGFDRLVLVGHSQGGLVIQRCLVRMLAEGRGLELARIRRVVLLATPNTGSELLSTLRRVLLPGNPQERGLRPFDELVSDTLRTVLRDVVNAPDPPTPRSCRIPFSVYAGESDAVVTRASAQAAFPDAAVLPGDHFTVAKPDSPRHRTYTSIRRLLLEAAEGPGPPTAVDTVTTLGPTRLEVHNAADAAANRPGEIPELTAYVPRGHDERLHTALADVLAGGHSRLVMLTGESSTGKTRALFEALLALAPHTPLLTPVDAAELLGMLESGRARPGCVLWLNEAQRFLYGSEGHEAAGRLRAVLSGTAGIAAVGTLWNTPYWSELTGTGSSAGIHEQARALLTHPGVTVRIDVPAHLDGEDLAAWHQRIESSDDRRLQQALAAGAVDGKVVQHLSGGPELLAAYLGDEMGGRLFTAAEHALITAALDARRLGHLGPLPVALLADAADGGLPARHRPPDPYWAEDTLHALGTGRRPDGTRTDVRDTLTALTPVRTRAGTPAAYEPDDYLDQHVRRLRADRRGTPALWTALIDHATGPEDLDRLAQAAWYRGMRTTAVRLWHRAVTAGHPTTGLAQLGDVLDPGYRAAAYSATHADLTDTAAVGSLLWALRDTGAEHAVTMLAKRAVAHADALTNPNEVTKLLKVLQEGRYTQQALTTLAERAAAHPDLTDPEAMAWLLRTFQEAGAEQAFNALVSRDLAAEADVTDPYSVGWLLRELPDAGAGHLINALADRAAAHTDATDPFATGLLLRTLRDAGAGDAVKALAERTATQIDITDLETVQSLLTELRGAGAEQAFSALAAGAVAHVDLTDAEAVASLLDMLRRAGAEQAVGPLAERAAVHLDLADAAAVASLLRELRQAGAEQAFSTLLGRGPAAHADLTDAYGVASLLRELRETGADQAISTLLDRDPAAHADLTDAFGTTALLRELREAEAGYAVSTLLSRDPAAHADVTNPYAPVFLLSALQEAGAEQAVSVLADRAAAGADVTDAHAVTSLLRELRRSGAEQAVSTFAGRAAAHIDVTDLEAVRWLLGELQEAGVGQLAVLEERAGNAGIFNNFFGLYGREPDGRPSPPWTANSIANP